MRINSLLQMYDGGKMDGADKITISCTPVPLIVHRPMRNSRMWNRLMFNRIFNSGNSTHSAIACFRQIKDPVFRRTSLLFQEHLRRQPQAICSPQKTRPVG